MTDGGVNTCKRHQSTDQTRPNQLSPHHACGRMWVAWISPYTFVAMPRSVAEAIRDARTVADVAICAMVLSPLTWRRLLLHGRRMTSRKSNLSWWNKSPVCKPTRRPSKGRSPCTVLSCLPTVAYRRRSFQRYLFLLCRTTGKKTSS